jgi:hypothetical protein
MSIKKKLLLAAVAGVVLIAPSCRKFLNVNDNPGVGNEVKLQSLLPAGQYYLATSVGVDMQVYGSIWSQYWTQAPVGGHYAFVEQFAPKQSDFSTSWKNLYLAGENFRQIYQIAETQHNKQYRAVSLVMQAYIFQALADGWGDVPFNESLRGQSKDGGITDPHYDSQVVVYRGVIKLIDSAYKWLDNADPGKPGSDDLVYGGDMNKWKKFASTLKLKALLRLADVDPLGTTVRMADFYATNPTFLAIGDDAKISAPQNPLYAELSSTTLGGVQQLAGSKTVIDSMNANNDYRGFVFFTDVAGALVGVPQGTYATPLTPGSYSTPSGYTGANITSGTSNSAPVMLLSAAESFFLQAEVAARGLAATSATDAAYFYEGIRASFLFFDNAMLVEKGVTGTVAYTTYINGDISLGIAPGYWTNYPTTGTVAQKLRYIITQKWFAMSGIQGFESWTEWRRTGYPDFLVYPASSVISPYRPQRFLYPSTEALSNSNFPGLVPLTTNVWWDIL